MRYILSIFLFSILIQNIITEQDILDRMARAAITLRNIVKYKQEQMRKLQVNTYTPEIEITVPTNLPEDIKNNANANATLNPEPEPRTEMPTTPNSTTPSTYQDKQDKLIQIRKFHKFIKKTNSTRLNFGAFLYFLNRIIPKNVIMRVVIRYSSRRTLRGLDDNIDAESVRTVCKLKDAYKEYEGKVGNGTNVDYDCNAETSKEGDVGEAKIDTEKPMVVGNESIEVSEIEFHPDSETGAQNLVNENSTQEIGVLSIEDVKTSEQNLTLTGKVIPKTLSLTGPYDIEFYDTERGEMKKLNCKAEQNKDDFTLVCDTSKNPLTTNYGNLTLSKIETDDLYASFNVPQGKEETPIIAAGSGNNIYYRKNSSGLSGGAIAGIVIACVVVLAAASIAAIMLRKPSPPIDNTTVVGLKTVENI